MNHDNPDGSAFTDEEFNLLKKGREGDGASSDPLKPGSDGLLSRKSPEYQGVLIRSMKAHNIKDFEQELKTAGFGSSDEGDELVSAYNECIVLGMDPMPLYHQMLARSAGVKHARLFEIYRTMTHQTHTINYPKGGKPDRKEEQPL